MDLVVKSDNDFMVKVKKDQKRLTEALEKITNENKPIDCFTTKERSRGRDEIRTAYLFSADKNIPEGWTSLNRIIKVVRDFKSKKEEHHTIGYYISSLISRSARKFLEGIRGHWLIENKLHYVKDVIFREDKTKTVKGQAAEKFSLIRNISINFLRCQKVPSIKQATIYYSANFRQLYYDLCRI
jgi:predicted transposase YbfD/YdcC